MECASLDVRSADLVQRAVVQFVIDGNPLACGQGWQAELGRMGFVVEPFGFLAPGNKGCKRSLIATLRDLELAQLEEFVIFLMELLPDCRFVIGKPGINLSEMEAQRPCSS